VLSSRAKLSLLAMSCAVAALALAHAVMETASRFAETELGASLWDGEDHLQLFTPSQWVDRGADRVMLCGPSEAREAFRLEVFERELPGTEAFAAAQSWGTLDDFVVMMEYVERVHGPSAMPANLVLGVTPRWASGGGLHLSPTIRYIDKYSPFVSTFESAPGSGLALVEKPFAGGLLARWRWRGRQEKRYMGAALALGREAARALRLDVVDDPALEDRLDVYKFAHRAPRSTALVEKFVERPQPLWAEVSRWDARADVRRIEREVERLRALCDRHDTALFVVNLPVRPAVRPFYDRELYDAYVEVLRGAFGDVPFLDLRDLLTDEEFFDSVHATRAGAERLSEAVAAVVARGGTSKKVGS
jgi:hypothetical protein